MCSPASVILASIETILLSFQAILIYFKALDWTITLNSLLKSLITEMLLKIPSKLTSNITILTIITLVGEHIFQVLGQYS